MPVRLGINPIGWTNDDLRWLGDDIPLETCLAEAREAGFSGVELGRKFPREPRRLRPILKRHGLDLVSGWYSARLLERDSRAEIAAMRQHLELLKALGSTVMVFAEGTGDLVPRLDLGLSQRPTLNTAAEWRQYGKRLTEVADHALAQGVRIAVHHHMGTIVQTASDIDRMLENCGESVGLLLDTGHMTYAGSDPVKVARRHAARIAHVHCKDVRRGALELALARDFTFTEAVLAGIFTAPGDGFVDFLGVFQALARVKYKGWIVHEAEQDPRVAHPLTYARIGHRTLSALAAKAGLKVAP